MADKLKPYPTEHPMDVREIHQLKADAYSTEYWLKMICVQLAEHNEQMRNLNIFLATWEAGGKNA